MRIKQKNSKESAFYETTDKQRRECFDKLYHEINFNTRDSENVIIKTICFCRTVTGFK